MTKKEFFIEVAERMDVPVRVVDEFFDNFVFILKEKLIAEIKVQLSILGTFEVKVKKGRTTINPFIESKDQIVVPEKRVVKYTPSKYLREIVNF
ncbi:HU family DNA-binding protein [Mycoplasmopsis hyopharyngis]|uniref:HU family DNA-binding protein n=1 Tax=Mycoplasmopsis hyopharyngis TaxID=29558 RepID=UPI003873B620